MATPKYLLCPNKKGQPKKHVDVCHKCKKKNTCKPYNTYRQPELPLA